MGPGPKIPVVTTEAPHTVARAATVVVRILEREPAGVSRASLERHLRDKLEPGALAEESMARLVRRALNLVRDLGYRVEERRFPATVRYRLAPEGSSRVLVLPPDMEAYRRWIAAALDLHRAGDSFVPDVLAILKQGIHAEIQFRYGSTADPIAGTPYFIDMSSARPVVHVETNDGPLGFRADAMREVRIMPRGTLQEGPAPVARIVEADPLRLREDPRAPRGRGRTGRETAFLLALRIAGLIRQRAGDADRAGRCRLPVRAVAEALKLGVSEVTGLSEMVHSVDDAIGIDEEDGCFWIEIRDREGTGHKMDGAAALTARLELSAFTSLAGAQWRLFDMDEIDEEEIAAYRRTLDAFLDRAKIIDPYYPGASAIVDAITRSDEITVTLFKNQSTHQLCPSGLELEHWQWMILGSLDGSAIENGDLALADISQVGTLPD